MVAGPCLPIGPQEKAKTMTAPVHTGLLCRVASCSCRPGAHLQRAPLLLDLWCFTAEWILSQAFVRIPISSSLCPGSEFQACTDHDGTQEPYAEMWSSEQCLGPC